MKITEKDPNNSVQRAFVISRWMFGVLSILPVKDTLKLTKLASNVQKVLLIMKRLNVKKEKELTELAKDIWKNSRIVSEMKISGDNLYFMLEYLSSLLTEKIHMDYLCTRNYEEIFRDTSLKDKVELSTIVIYMGNELEKTFGIPIATETVRKPKKKKVKVKKDRKSKVVVKKQKNVKRFLAKKKTLLTLKEMVKAAKDRKSKMDESYISE